MSISAAELIGLVKITGATESAAKLATVGTAVDGVGARLGAFAAGAAIIASAALVGIGVESVKMAGDFQQSTNTLITSAGLSRGSIEAVRTGILKMSVDTATSTDQLVKGMFNVESALHLGVGGLQVLKAAAEGAKAENSDLAQTTDVLTTAMVNYHLSAAQAVPTMDSLIATVAAGKMHMDDLTGSLKNVLPVAAAFHIHLSDVEGALSTMANAGDRGTIAGTHLAMMFKMLSSPVGAAKKEMAAMGLDSIKLAETMRTSLPAALKMIQDAVAQHFKPGSVEYERAILAILGGSKSGVAGLEILNQGLKTLGKNTSDAASALRKGSKDVENWDVIQQNFNFKLDATKNAVSALMITIGNALLPVLGKALDYVTPLILQFTDWVQKNHVVENSLTAVGTAISNTVGFIQNMISIGVSVVNFFQQNQWAAAALGVAIGALGGVMALFAASSVANMILSMLEYGLSILTAVSETVTGAAVMSSTFGTMSDMIIASMGAAASSILATLGPFLLAGAVIAAVSIGVVLAVQHWGEISAWLQSTWSAVITWFNGALQTVGNAVQPVIAWFEKWGYLFQAVGIGITVFFLPALIQAGIQATISGGEIATTFVAVLLASGVAAVQSAAQITISFIASMFQAGVQAVVTGYQVTTTFIAVLLASGLAAIQSAAQITLNFVAAVITTGIQGWIAAGKLALYIGSLIATGAQSIIAGAAVAGRFIVAVISSGVEAVIAGVKLAVSYVGGLIASASQAGITATTLYSTIIPALYATGTAATAAAGVFGLLALAIIGTVATVKYEIDNMHGNVISNYNDMRSHVTQASYSMAKDTSSNAKTMSDTVSQHADSMKIKASKSVEDMHANMTKELQGITSDSYNAFYQMQYSGQVNLDKLQKDVAAAFARIDSKDNKGKLKDIGDAAKALFDAMKVNAVGDLSAIDQSAQSYLQSILDYVKQAQKALADLNAWNAGLTPEQKIQQQHGTGNIYNKNAYAEGTSFAPGGMALVGEKGPEVVYLPRGAQVIPNHQLSQGSSKSSSSSSSSSSGSSTPIILMMDNQIVARGLMPHIVDQIRYNTGIVGM